MLQWSVKYVLRVFKGCSYWVFHRCFRERSSITSARLGGVGGLSQNADTADALEGWVGGLSQNADMLTLWRERVGELKHRASICDQILEIINKLITILLTHDLISLNTDPTHKNIFLTILEKHILLSHPIIIYIFQNQ